ncbi:MAG: hypothetical protein HY868_08565 [Chloroflexi bacterium]|nr:hypothetical protein [Chloroflexota bacterium]
MSRTMKIVLLVGGTLTVICVLACVVLVFFAPRVMQNFATNAQNPEQIKQTAAKIAEYTLPSGYKEEFGMDLFAMQMVMIAPANKARPMIMLMQSADRSAKPEDMQQQLQEQFQRQYSMQGGTYRVTGTRQVRIKGQSVTLTIAENDSRSVTMQQATGVFAGKNGLAILMLIGTKQGWDWTPIEQFTGSIR